jgi:hypothetical protein
MNVVCLIGTPDTTVVKVGTATSCHLAEICAFPLGSVFI